MAPVASTVCHGWLPTPLTGLYRREIAHGWGIWDLKEVIL